jgi:hypothetical protein
MTEIKLKVDVSELRSFYFENNEHRYFFGPNTKKQSTYLLLSLVVYPFYTIHTLNTKDQAFFMFGTILLSLIVNDYLKVALPIIKWKKSVETFLKEAEKIKDLRFIYSDDYVIHISDNQEIKQNWEIIEKAVINDRFIWLFSDNNILLPKNAMKEEEYQALIELIKIKVKNVEKK